ncbi:hypothetical protein F4808DRAFT_450917 [Astrocystis sublimbata]|nr:hypothetical protein F4808DRAFT_450917 [Astrocystis sublimbata]
MSIEIALNTPLADALTGVIQPKLMEVGWAQSNDDAALSEYIILMLVNGKTQEQIAGELAGDLLNLGPDDPAARDFTHWLFEQINILQSQLNGGAAQAESAPHNPFQTDAVPMEQDVEMSTSVDSPELNAPTGPKSMRNGNMRGGAREKRMFGQMTKAMDRSHDSVLHRVRGNGNERINAHGRAPPTGPRGGRGNNRMMNNRAAGITAGLNQMAGGMPGMPPPPGMNGMADMSWMMPGGGQQDTIFQLLQQQNQMMAALQQQLAQQNQGGNNNRNGKSLFDRAQNPRGGRRGGHQANNYRAQQNGSPKPADGSAAGEDVDMSQARTEAQNPESAMCKFNLTCSNRDCKFAHQSPAAPPNTTVDPTDVCSFGAACKNWKCVGRHPSPATKRAHQNIQECKFYPNCTNMHCPFKHPDMPPCRNGGDCAVEGCKFTHLQTMCKFKPCKNRYCPFKHEEGQRGTFPDKVWTADGSQSHVSERQFVDKAGPEEFIISGDDLSRTSVRYLGTVPRVRTCHPSLNRSSALCASPSTAVQLRKQQYATAARSGQSRPKPREIAVLGAGITGLTAAHYLARHAKDAHITIYEASDRPGGWIKADRVEVEDDQGRKGHVLLQKGPRMLRSGSVSTKYDDLVLYDVLANLNMGDKIRHPNPISGNRYLYYPDHLVKLPSAELSVDNILGAIQSFLTEPVWSGGVKAALGYWSNFNKSLMRADNPQEWSELNQFPEDELTVARFLTRLLGDDRIVNNIVSGMMHGIYGGDIHKLSAKHTMLENLWYQHKRPLNPAEGQSYVHTRDIYLVSDMLSGPNRLKIIELAEQAIGWKLLAFEDGLLTLVKGLVDDLKKKSNVSFRYGEPVTSLKQEHGKVLVTTSKTRQPAKYDHVISTLFSKQMAQITEPANSLPSLAETHAVTIMVVNLWYPNPDLLGEGGFGYLIPSTTPDNEEGALGMPGTKLTVMLGEEMGIAMAKELVRRQLGISDSERHFLGHRERMEGAHFELFEVFGSQLTVAGPSYTTIGVIPAMRAGFDAGMRVARGHAQPWFRLPEELRAVGDEDNADKEIDYWSHELQEDAGVIVGGDFGDENGRAVDINGTTGLESFTEDEWEYLQPFPKDKLLFRKFTRSGYRFRDEDREYLEVEDRARKNAPPEMVELDRRWRGRGGIDEDM